MPLLAGLLLACPTSAPPPSLTWVAGAPLPLEPADAVAAADMDGDGTDEIIRIRHGVAHWRDQQAELGGSLQAVARADLDGDGRQEALIASGMGRSSPDAPARLWSIGLAGATMLWERDGPRNQVTALYVEPLEQGRGQRVFLAAFRDGKTVEGGYIEQGALMAEHSATMATSMMPVEGGLLVGRMYGDEPRSDGELYLQGATKTPLPSLRGVRTMAKADLDGDGRMDWLVADGWHHAYGQQAQASIRLFPGDGAPARVIANLGGSYTVTRMEVIPAPEGGSAMILATGSNGLHLLVRDGLGWAPFELVGLNETDNAVLHREGDALSVIISGVQARRVPLLPSAAILPP